MDQTRAKLKQVDEMPSVRTILLRSLLHPLGSIYPPVDRFAPAAAAATKHANHRIIKAASIVFTLTFVLRGLHHRVNACRLCRCSARRHCCCCCCVRSFEQRFCAVAAAAAAACARGELLCSHKCTLSLPLSPVRVLISNTFDPDLG